MSEACRNTESSPSSSSSRPGVPDPSTTSDAGCSSQPSPETMNTERPAASNASHSDTNVWDRNRWDMQRLKELDRNKNWREQWNPRMSMSFSNTKGLLNAPGDNNCFLNSAVQVLWHLDVFRRSFRMLSGHSCLGRNSCIFCALKVIFTQFQYSDQSCLPPDALRKALAKTFADQQRFQLGLMDDAAECFENILTQIHFHIANGESEDMCNAKHCISHQKFAMTIIEQVVCPCQATSEPLPFSQMVHYVSTSTLVSQAKTANGAATFGQLLKGAISEGDYRNCPSNCGRKVQLRRTLLNSPDVVSVGLVWDSENPSTQHIHDVVWSIGTTLQLRDLFHDVVDVRCKQGSKLYLVGVVCYYGKHYSTFFYHSKMKTWVSFDDANVKEMGSDWSTVVDKCCRGHYQPLLLLYANPDAEVIDVKTAPQKTVIVKETAFLSNSDENGSGLTGSYHCRQRSCDSLSGTIGGQCVDDSYSESLRAKRSVTPNPDSGKEKVQALPRRAITPGPEWGHYDSDDDSHTNVSGVIHQRQSSYLNALDCVDGLMSSSGQRPPANNVQRPPSSFQKYGEPDVNKQVWNPSISQYQAQPSYQDAQQHYRNNSAQYSSHSGAQHDCTQHHVSQGQSCSTAGYGSVCSESTITSLACSTTTYQVAPSHKTTNCHYSTTSHMSHHSSNQCSMQTPVMVQHKNSQQYIPASPTHHANTQQHMPPYHSSHYGNNHQAAPISHIPRYSSGQQPVATPHTSRSGNSQQHIPAPHQSDHPVVTQTKPMSYRPQYNMPQQTIPNPHYTASKQSAPVSSSRPLPESAPSTPGMKRAQSMENPDSLLSHGPASLSRSRPSSARPYDYGNSRPTVDPSTGTVIMPGSHQVVPPGIGSLNSEWNEGVLIGDFTTPDSCLPEPVTQKKKGQGTRWESQINHVSDDDDDCGTYINPKTVQNVLNIQKSHHSRPLASASAGTSSNLECDQKSHKAWMQNQSMMPDLRVDIPGDNISLGSHKDSGYRSGSSSGDRNSASSTSSMSFDSPTAENFRGFAGIHRPLAHTCNSLSHSSSESLSSTHSGQTVKNIQGNRLSLIPENTPSSSTSSLTINGNKSQESLNNSTDALDGYMSEKAQDRWETHRERPNEAPNFLITNQNHGPDAECKKLFLQAEAVLEMSTKQEECNDINLALSCSNQAINLLQMALVIPGISNDTAVHVRMKQNACVLRSRKLQKQLAQWHNARESSGSQSLSHSAESSVPSNLINIPKNDGTFRTSEKAFKPDGHQQAFDGAQTKGQSYEPNLQLRHNVQYNSSQVARTLAVSGIAQSRPVHGITMGRANIPCTTTDSNPPQYGSHETKKVHQEQQSALRNSISSDDLNAKDARYVEIYGTLPKRKGKGCKSPQDTRTAGPRPEENRPDMNTANRTEQSGGVNSADRMPVEPKTEPPNRIGLINHSRQWSKSELRDILLKDFMNRPKPVDNQSKSKDQGKTLQRRNSYDLLESSKPCGSSPCHSRQNSCEDLLSNEMKQLSTKERYPDLPPKQKTASRKFSQIPQPKLVQEESHYDYLPLRTKPNQSEAPEMTSGTSANSYDPTSGSSSSSSGMTLACESGMTVVGITGIPNRKQTSTSAELNSRQVREDAEWKSAFCNPYSSKRELPTVPSHHSVGSSEDDCQRFYPKPSAIRKMDKPKPVSYPKSYQAQKSSGQGVTAIAETVPIQVKKPDTPPKPAHKSNKSSKPDVPKRKTSQLSTFKCDTNVSSNSLHMPGPANPMPSNQNVATQDRVQPPAYVQPPPPPSSTVVDECDLPPPPADLLYPPLNSEVPDHSVEQYTSDDRPLNNGYQIPNTEYHMSSGTNHQTATNMDGIQHAITPAGPCPTPTKPALSKAKKLQKARKCVTFNENIALIATPEEVPQEIDYVAYVMNLGKNKALKCIDNNNAKSGATSFTNNNEADYNDIDDDDDDDDDNTSDSMDSDAVLCNLCRKKKIHPPEIYCEHCCFYMSQFQPQVS